MRPAEAQRLFRRSPGDQPVDKAGGKAVAPADAAEHVELAGGADEPLAVEPEHRGPVVAIGRMDLPQRGGHQLDVGMLFDHAVDELEERVGIELRLMVYFGSGDAEPLLQVFLISPQYVDLAHDAVQDVVRTLDAADRIPQFGPVIEIERDDGPGSLGRLYCFDDQIGSRF